MKRRGRYLLLYAVLLATAALFLFPFYWMLISSVKSRAALSMTPPSLYPAEVRTVDLALPAAGRLIGWESQRWLRLCRSENLLAPAAEAGGYYVLLDGAAPTQRVRWLADAEVAPLAAPPQVRIVFARTPVHRLRAEERDLPVVARMVRPGADGYDEVLITADASGSEINCTARLNVAHRQLRTWAPRWRNYAETLAGPDATFGKESVGFLHYMRNSFIISGLAVLGQVLSSSLVAFAFARLRFRGRDGLFIVLLATLMLPAQVTLIPMFWIYKSLGWINTFLPLIVPHFTAGAFNVFLIRQYLLTLPRELDESAAIDGCGAWGTFRHIILPNCKPVLIVVAIFTFVYTWQDVMGPLIYLDDPNLRTVTLGLEYFRSPYVDNRHLIMTGAVLAMLPVALVFLLLQRYIMAGIATTGLKA